MLVPAQHTMSFMRFYYDISTFSKIWCARKLNCIWNYFPISNHSTYSIIYEMLLHLNLLFQKYRLLVQREFHVQLIVSLYTVTIFCHLMSLWGDVTIWTFYFLKCCLLTGKEFHVFLCIYSTYSVLDDRFIVLLNLLFSLLIRK